MRKPGRYRAKRFGWNVTEEDPDRTPYWEMGYESEDIEGELEIVPFEVNGKRAEMHLVGGQEADPATVERIDRPATGDVLGEKG